MRLFVSGSAPLLVETFDAWAQRTGHTILERYGMSETVMLTTNPYREQDGERRGGTVGFPLPGVQLRVRDEPVQPCPAGEIGGIEVKGPNVFAGYWRMPEKTDEEFTADGWFKTGDVGKIDERGYVTIVGRSKDLDHHRRLQRLPGRGRRLTSTSCPASPSRAVIGVPHPDFGEGVVAVVVPKPGSELDGTAIVGAEGPHRQLQGAQAGVRGQRTAAQHDGQGAEEPAARAAPGAVWRLTAAPTTRRRAARRPMRAARAAAAAFIAASTTMRRARARPCG